MLMYVMSMFYLGCGHLESFVIIDQPGHGRLLNPADRNSFGCGNLSQDSGKMPGDGTDEMYFVNPVIVLHHITFEEIGKAPVHDPADALVSNIVEQERSHAGKKTTGKGLAVDLVDDHRRGELLLLQQLLPQSRSELVLECVTHQLPAQGGTATLVTQDETEG